MLAFDRAIPTGSAQIEIRLRRTVRGRPAGSVPGAGGRALVRVHAVRAHRRAPRVPVLRRARLQDAVRRRDRRARRTWWRSSNMHEVGAPSGAARRCASSSSDRRRCRRTWSRSPSARSTRGAGAAGQLPVRLVADPGQGGPRRSGPRDRARRAGRRSERYFGRPYPYAKLDLVAVPDVRRRRDGERRPHHVPRGAAAARRARVARRRAVGMAGSSRTSSRTSGSAIW